MTNYFLIVHCEFCILNCELNLFPLRRIPHSDCFTTPAAGYRHWSTGALVVVGGEGHGWSSSPGAAGAVEAGYLCFDVWRMEPLHGWHRSSGFAVRCVQHLRELPPKADVPPAVVSSGDDGGAVPAPGRSQIWRHLLRRTDYFSIFVVRFRGIKKKKSNTKHSL